MIQINMWIQILLFVQLYCLHIDDLIYVIKEVGTEQNGLHVWSQLRFVVVGSASDCPQLVNDPGSFSICYGNKINICPHSLCRGIYVQLFFPVQ